MCVRETDLSSNWLGFHGEETNFITWSMGYRRRVTSAVSLVTKERNDLNRYLIVD